MAPCPTIVSQPARAVWIEIPSVPAPALSWPWSQPARAVWIEIMTGAFLFREQVCHSLRGLCGLKLSHHWDRGLPPGHSLRGLCGLKFHIVQDNQVRPRHSLRGLCGLKSISTGSYGKAHPSQPARAVWIEILSAASRASFSSVTACEGCVD